MSQKLASRLSWSIGLLLGLLAVALAALTTPAYGYDNSLAQVHATAQAEPSTTLMLLGGMIPGLYPSSWRLLPATPERIATATTDGANVARHATEATRSGTGTARLPRRLPGSSPTSLGGLLAPQTARLNLPFRDAGLRSQVDDVVRHFDEFGMPPRGVAQGGLRGYPQGTYGGQGLPSKSLGYYTESDVWVSGGGIKRGAERLVFGQGGEVYYR